MDDKLKQLRKAASDAKTVEQEDAAERDLMVEYDRLNTERRRLISPSCCEASRRTRAIYVTVDDDGANPSWCVRLAGNSRDFTDAGLSEEERVWYRSGTTEPFVPVPKHCPFCGKWLPSIVKKEVPPEPLHKYDGHSRCNTCSERCMNCVCWPPWAAYETTYCLFRGELVLREMNEIEKLIFGWREQANRIASRFAESNNAVATMSEVSILRKTADELEAAYVKLNPGSL